MLSTFLRLTLVIQALLSSLSAAEHPHILLILADDLGYSDLASFGGEIDTPHLDRLAAGGLRFSQFYTAGSSAPTRAALLTGRQPHQVGMGWRALPGSAQPGYRGEMDSTTPLLPEILVDHGYSTFLAGTWQLTRNDHLPPREPAASWPSRRGFQRVFAALEEGGSYYEPHGLVEGKDPLSLTELSTPFYLTDAITEAAITFLEESLQQPDTPFFGLVTYTAPHWPLQAPPGQDLEKYRSRYREGWNVLRQERLRRQRAMGLLPANHPLAPLPPGVPAWETLETERQTDLVERMAVYAAQVERMDDGIGRLVEFLTQRDQLENTLILFLSDNGANGTGGVFGYDQRPDVPPGSPSSQASYGQGWATLSNTPFRGQAEDLYQGGVTSPLIVHWPNRLPEKGRLRTGPVHVMDLMPTCLEAADAALPEDERQASPLAGESLISVFRGMAPPRPRFFWEFQGHRALRHDHWKLVSPFNKPWELYHLEEDPCETRDVAREFPAVVDQLSSLWQTLAGQADVLPIDGRPWQERLPPTARPQGQLDTEAPDANLPVPAPGMRAPDDGKSPAPNIIFILFDDLGYGDLGCLGSETHRTPRIDTMAEEGVILTHFYSASGFCTPSRAAFLTGSYPRRVGMHMNFLPPGTTTMRQVLFPVSHRGLHPDEWTIAEALRDHGYATACVGKWHLGDQPDFLPSRQGFDQYYGIPYSNDMGAQQFPANPPLPLLQQETVMEAPVEQTTLTQRYTEEAVRFIREHQRQPFFLFLPHTMPHNPIHVSQEFRDQSGNGPYADCVEELDWSTGRLLDTLEELGLTANTLVILTSDNGAARAWGGSNAPLSGFKGTVSEGGMRVPLVARWPGHLPAGHRSDALTTAMDLFPTLLNLVSLPQKTPLDGVDIWPLLSNQPGAQAPDRAFYYYQQDQLQAVRQGPWKLYLPLKEERQPLGAVKVIKDPVLRLYHLENDVSESDNVAASHPEIVAALQAAADEARKDLGDLRQDGENTRAPGHVNHPLPLRLSEEP